ncbi:MAG: hypothetical protein U9R44_03975 [Candidatus Omnitrophota bacterium]|nr:hypothetical protein [Candidatus Omnitrophota bacterium]
MKVGIDVDDTILRTPELFSVLSRALKDNGHEVYIVTTRPRTGLDRKRTLDDLSRCDVVYDVIYHLPKQEGEVDDCPHEGLDDYQKFVWQKVRYCREKGIDIFFDDDSRLIEVFKRYAPEIQVFHVCKHDIGL